MLGCCANLFTRPEGGVRTRHRRGSKYDEDLKWKTRETNNNLSKGDDSFSSGLQPPVFYIDSGESTDTDSQKPPVTNRRSANQHGLTPQERLDPNSQLQHQSRLNHEKLPSLSAVDRSRRPPLMRLVNRQSGSGEDRDEVGEFRLIHEPLRFETFRSASPVAPPLAVIAPLKMSPDQLASSSNKQRLQKAQYVNAGYQGHEEDEVTTDVRSDNHTKICPSSKQQNGDCVVLPAKPDKNNALRSSYSVDTEKGSESSAGNDLGAERRQADSSAKVVSKNRRSSLVHPSDVLGPAAHHWNYAPSDSPRLTLLQRLSKFRVGKSRQSYRPNHDIEMVSVGWNKTGQVQNRKNLNGSSHSGPADEILSAAPGRGPLMPITCQLSCPGKHKDSVCEYHHGGFINEGFNLLENDGETNAASSKLHMNGHGKPHNRTSSDDHLDPDLKDQQIMTAPHRVDKTGNLIKKSSEEVLQQTSSDPQDEKTKIKKEIASLGNKVYNPQGRAAPVRPTSLPLPLTGNSSKSSFSSSRVSVASGCGNEADEEDAATDRAFSARSNISNTSSKNNRGCDGPATNTQTLQELETVLDLHHLGSREDLLGVPVKEGLRSKGDASDLDSGSRSQNEQSLNEVSSDSEQPVGYTLKTITCGDRSVCWSAAIKTRKTAKPTSPSNGSQNLKNEKQSASIHIEHLSKGSNSKKNKDLLEKRQCQGKIYKESDSPLKGKAPKPPAKVAGLLEQKTEQREQDKAVSSAHSSLYTSTGKKVAPKKPKRKNPPSNASTVASREAIRECMTTQGEGSFNETHPHVTQTVTSDLAPEKNDAASVVSCGASSTGADQSDVNVKSLNVVPCGDVDDDESKVVAWLCLSTESTKDEDYADFESFDEINGSLV